MMLGMEKSSDSKLPDDLQNNNGREEHRMEQVPIDNAGAWFLIMNLFRSRNPFAYVAGTVSEFDSVRLRDGKSVDRLPTN